MDIEKVARVVMCILIVVCFLGAAYSIGYEGGLRSECNRNDGVLIDMRCIDKKFLNGNNNNEN